MRIAFDHQIFSFQRYGGVSRYFYELATRLQSNASNVTIIAPLHVNKYLLSESARSITRGRYVPYTFTGVPPAIGLANRFAAPLVWRGETPDVVHETYFSKRPAGKGRRRVLTVYDMIHEMYWPKAKSVIAAKRAAIDRADHIICISQNTRRDLLRIYDIDPSRTSVVHLGYSLTETAAAPEIGNAERKPSLLFVGHRGGYKNFSTLLQAISNSEPLNEFELIAFGGFPMDRRERAELGRLGIADRVRFVSGSDRELAAHYQTATAFIYPSKYEGFGIPPLEAMSHGCPVVCSNGGAIPEVVGDAGVYFDPDSPADLRAALERVVTSSELQTDLRTRGYARLAAFSWDKCAEETARIYRSIV